MDEAEEYFKNFTKEECVSYFFKWMKAFEKDLDALNAKCHKQEKILSILKRLFTEESLEDVGNEFGINVNGACIYMKSREDLRAIEKWLFDEEDSK